MNIVVLGQGAMGLLWTAHLAKIPTIKVTARHTRASDAKGINFTHHLGQTEFIHVPHASDDDLTCADLIIVCLKAFHVATELEKIYPHLSDKAIIALCHNGIGTLNEISAFISERRIVLTMLCSHGAFRPTKSHVIHTGLGMTDIGLIHGQISDYQTNEIVNVLHAALPKVIWHQGIKQKQWLKLAINAVINPLTAINGIKNGDLILPKFSPIIEQLAVEISDVAKKEGVELSPKTIIDTVMLVAQNTAKNHSSMRCDVDNNQTTEITYISGYISSCGKVHGIPTPMNDELLSKIQSMVAVNEF